MSSAFRHIPLLVLAACFAGLAPGALLSVAAAQDGPEMFEHEVLVSPVDLAAHPTVQQDLGIDSETQQKIFELADYMRERTGEILRDRNLLRPLRMAALTQIRGTAEKKLYALLDEQQKQRIEQLRLQHDGYLSLARPALEEEFELSLSQGPIVRQAVREFYRWQQRLLIDMRYDKVTVDVDELPQLVEREKKKFNDRLEKHLTAEQKAKWKRTIGEPLFFVLEPLQYTSDSLERVKELVESGEAVLLDVREQDEWDDGHVEGAVWMPYSELTSKENRPRVLRKLLRTVPREMTVYCYSNAGRRALVVVNLIRELSYDARALEPGYVQLIEAGFAASQ